MNSKYWKFVANSRSEFERYTNIIYARDKTPIFEIGGAYCRFRIINSKYKISNRVLNSFWKISHNSDVESKLVVVGYVEFDKPISLESLKKIDNFYWEKSDKIEVFPNDFESQRYCSVSEKESEIKSKYIFVNKKKYNIKDDNEIRKFIIHDLDQYFTN